MNLIRPLYWRLIVHRKKNMGDLFEEVGEKQNREKWQGLIQKCNKKNRKKNSSMLCKNSCWILKCIGYWSVVPSSHCKMIFPLPDTTFISLKRTTEKTKCVFPKTALYFWRLLLCLVNSLCPPSAVLRWSTELGAWGCTHVAKIELFSLPKWYHHFLRPWFAQMMV